MPMEIVPAFRPIALPHQFARWPVRRRGRTPQAGNRGPMITGRMRSSSAALPRIADPTYVGSPVRRREAMVHQRNRGDDRVWSGALPFAIMLRPERWREPPGEFLGTASLVDGRP